NSIAVKCGTEIGMSVSGMNLSEAICGPDAKLYRPERWLEPYGITKKAHEIKGHRHFLASSNGPRVCTGNFLLLLTSGYAFI
ncbi:hypothetical protein F5141DRAFT_1009784, partial [Pisolithus sp. B1]